MPAACSLEHFDMAVFANHAHKLLVAVLFGTIRLSAHAFKTSNTYAPLYKASIVGLAEQTMIEFKCGTFRFKTEQVEMLKTAESSCCCWLLYSGREKAKAEKLSNSVLLAFAAAKVELDIVYPIGIDDGKSIASRWEREGTWVTNGVAKLYSKPQGFECYPLEVSGFAPMLSCKPSVSGRNNLDTYARTSTL